MAGGITLHIHCALWSHLIGFYNIRTTCSVQLLVLLNELHTLTLVGIVLLAGSGGIIFIFIFLWLMF